MRLTRLPVFAPIAAAGASAAWVGVSTWNDMRMGLVAALSVIAAAALVRLARGLPFTNADHFEPAEVEAVTEAVKRIARALRLLLGITLGTMVLLVVAATANSILSKIPHVDPNILERCLSALIGATLSYVLARIWQVVGSDISLLDEQAKFLVRAVHRKQGKKHEEQVASATAPPFKTPEGYGKRLQ